MGHVEDRDKYPANLLFLKGWLNEIASLFNIESKFQNLRKKSIHKDRTNLGFIKQETKSSKLFNEDLTGLNQDLYFQNVFSGKIEMEIDQRAVYMGVARGFIKIFKNMRITT